jgi:F-type H+-transporting ATPase subunit epsilon
MTKTLQLEVMTPDKKVVDAEVDAMRVLLPDGWWGILPNHAPMISRIDSGFIRYTVDKVERFIALYQGTIEVQRRKEQSSRVLVLTAAAEEGDDLDAVQSELEKQSAQLAKQAKKADLEFTQLRLSLEKAIREAAVEKRKR